MLTEELRAAGAAKGYRCSDENGTISGVVNGIAFRAEFREGFRLEMSVSIPEKQLPQMEKRLTTKYPGVSVEPYRFGILLILPEAETMTGERFTAFLEAAAAEALKDVGATHDEKFERYGEPFYVYLRGAAGAFLGALVGAIPWLLVNGGWFSVWLGGLISAASFFGYRLFKGAHHTTFATVCVLFFSLVSLFGAEFVPLFTSFWFSGEYATVGEAVRAMGEYIIEAGPAQFFGSLGLGVAFGLVGLFSIRKYISVYTHEPRFLRRRKDPKNK